MRILDNDSNRVLDDVLILLTRREAESLRDAIRQMLSETEQEHYHIIDLDIGRPEFVIGLYDEVDTMNNTYAPRVIDLIRDNK